MEAQQPDQTDDHAVEERICKTCGLPFPATKEFFEERCAYHDCLDIYCRGCRRAQRATLKARQADPQYQKYANWFGHRKGNRP